MRTAPGLRGGLAVVRPAGDPASIERARLAQRAADERARLAARAADERARLAASEADERARRATLERAGIQAGTTVLEQTGNVIDREQNRALDQQRADNQLALERMRGDRDLELERIRSSASNNPPILGANLGGAYQPAAPGSQFSVLGLASTQGQAPAAPTAPTGVLGWMRENPVVVGVGVLGFAAVAYYAFAPKKKGRR